MSVQNVQHITLDFCRTTGQTVYVKQYDKNSRYLIVKCTDNGKLIKLDKSLMSCRVKIFTPSEKAIYDDCEVLEDGTVKVLLSETALSSSGVANAELSITSSDNTQRMGTMKFRIIIDSSVYSDNRIIASDEFNALTTLFEKADKNYTYIITEVKKNADAAKISEVNAKLSETKSRTSETNAKKSENNATISATNAKNSEINSDYYSSLAKSYAIGETDQNLCDGIDDIVTNDDSQISIVTRNGETTDNAKYYSNIAKEQAITSSSSANSAKSSEANAKKSEQAATTKASEASASATNAKNSETVAIQKADSASTSATNAASSANNAKSSETNALNSANASKNSADNSSKSESNAKSYMDSAKSYSEHVDLVSKSIDSKLSSITKILSQTEYNALSQEQKLNGTIYFIK